ncbi:MAG: ComF family protein [Myxococcales bacterium]|nr:ComF family protein [Myxococcales bacterium]
MTSLTKFDLAQLSERIADIGIVLPLSTVSNAILRALYPPSCAACDDPLSTTTGMCTLCFESCEPIGMACTRCARPISTSQRCPCARSASALESCTACFEYGGQLAVALRLLKFSGRNDIAYSLSGLLSGRFAYTAAICDLAIAVPLHRTRLRKRGFNQAQRLLSPLAKMHQLAQPRRLLVRHRATPAQSTLSRAERTANLRGAFRAAAGVRGKRILLLDDVRTTGATLQAAATALQRAGASEIHGFVVARTEWEG